MWLFQQEKLSVAILEAGLGGRLDATTACKADILGISEISLDHQHILGDTVTQIAYEKAYAARAGELVIASNQTPEALRGLAQAQKHIGFELRYSPKYTGQISLAGDYQQDNSGLALSLVNNLGLVTKPELNSYALSHTKWPGRLEELVRDDVKIILDGAHNPSGIKLLGEYLARKNKKLVIIFGSMSGVNCHEKISLLLSSNLDIKYVYIYKSKNPRSESAENLTSMFLQAGFEAHKLSSYENLEQCISKTKLYESILLVCGSLYVVGELRGQILNIIPDQAGPNF